MERRLKERLTGAAVIVMLAVIFIPMILDNSGQDELGIKASNIPPRPGMTFTPPVVGAEPPPPSVAAADPLVADPAAAGAEDSETVVADPVAADPVPAAAEHAEADGGEVAAWIVQLGSFSSGDNARGLARRLQEAGFPAYIDEVRIATGVVYRVRVGPEIRKADAEATRDRLGKKLDLKGIVLRHP